jgi:hypothetical protein
MRFNRARTMLPLTEEPKPNDFWQRLRIEHW